MAGSIFLESNIKIKLGESAELPSEQSLKIVDS